MMDRDRLTYLTPYPHGVEVADRFPQPCSVVLRGDALPARVMEELAAFGVALGSAPDAYPLTFQLDPGVDGDEAYSVRLAPTGLTLSGSTAAGLSHGFQTFLQLIALWSASDHWPDLAIQDRPAYAQRGFMLDLGRSVFPLPMLKRVVRLLQRLKMNRLHLHLMDDELCGLRFDGLPFGEDNPFALRLDELHELIRYAGERHIEVIPELETWGHVGSLACHRPALRGGPGMFNGASFLLGPEAFALVETMADQVVSVMPDAGTLHLGLDEAKWFADPALPADYDRAALVRHYREMVRRLSDKHGKDLAMQVWCDHKWDDLPRGGDAEGIVFEPWQYWARNSGDIDAKIERFADMPEIAWVMGVGQSKGHIHGAHRATRHFCRRAGGVANCRGLDACLWGWNDLEHKLITLFSAGYFGWNPQAPTDLATIEDAEEYEWKAFQVMQWWQSAFADADPDAIAADRGPLVFNGYYLWGDQHGRPVSPTVPAAGTRKGHDFVREAEGDKAGA